MSGETPVEVTVDTHQVIAGNVSVAVDGAEVTRAGADAVIHRIVGPTSSVSVSANDAQDISGAGYDNESFDIAGTDPGPTGITFRSDGTEMFVSGGDSDTIHSYDLSSAWDLSTASHDATLDLGSDFVTLSGFALRSPDAKMYLLDHYCGDVLVYRLAFGGTAYASVTRE